MSDRYGRFFESVLLPLWEGGLRGRPTQTLVKQLERSQWRSLDEIEALRVGALRRLLRHAWLNVPFYRARFDAAGFHPEDVRATSDLARLPPLTRAQALESSADRKSRSAPLPTINKSTGGTTGEPMRFAYDEGSEVFRQAIKRRGWGWAGYRPGGPTLFYWPDPPNPSLFQRLKIRADRRVRRERYFDCVHRGAEEMDAVVAAIRATPPLAIVCYSQAGADLARHVNARGLRQWKTIPILCCAERLSPADRAVIAEAFGPSVFETYGTREVMLIAAECEAHEGMHVSAENLIVEVVVPTSDGGERPARQGESGEVLVTDLHNLGMPLIRYAIGDRAVMAAEGTCRCGRTLPRIASLEGRVCDTLHDGQGANVSGIVFNVLFTRYAADVRQFQAVQRRDGAVLLKLVPNPGHLDEATRATILARTRELIPGVDVQTQVVDEIPPGRNGKRRVVIVEH